MSGARGVNGRQVFMIGTWEVTFRGVVLGRVNAIDEERAIRRAAKKWVVGPIDVEVVNVLPTVYHRDATDDDRG